MLHKPIRNIQDFLLSTYFADGLRISFGVLCPSLIMAHYGLLNIGLTLSTGALCASIADSPGPIVHRRNAMLITTLLITVVYTLVGLTNWNIYVSALLLASCSFVFSMFFLYGTRATAIGTSVLLIMVLSIDDLRPWRELLQSAGWLFLGSIWYTLLSYSTYRLRPYRIAQQTLSDSVIEVANFLRTKAKFYHLGNDYDKTYTELLQLQVDVNLKQDEVRDVLLRTREIVRESTPQGRFLLVVFTDMVDLFEQVMSTYYNYQQLHQQFDTIGILEKYEDVINEIAFALDDIGFALKTNAIPRFPELLNLKLKNLRDEIVILEKQQEASFSTIGLIALKNIEINIENIVARVKTIHSYFSKTTRKNLKGSKDIDVDKFVTKQNFGRKLFVENLSFKSSTFRHSLRVAIVMLFGFIVAKVLDFSHSYWILLTILVILKPGFSLTKERNYQRLIGTIIGAFIGMGVLTFVHDKNVLFVILLIGMVGAYSFQRKNYVVSVVFMTPYILLLFEFLGAGSISLARERIYDTLIGSAIALIANYFVLPTWEYEKLKETMREMVIANLGYFKEVAGLYFEPSAHHLTKYKVARKDVYVTSAELSSLFQRMFSEPKSKQKYMVELHQFTVLNHLLTSYTASLSLYYKEHNFNQLNFDDLQPLANNTSYLLNLASENLVKQSDELTNVPLVRRTEDDKLPDAHAGAAVVEQFDLIQKVAYDIFKLTEKLNM